MFPICRRSSLNRIGCSSESKYKITIFHGGAGLGICKFHQEGQEYICADGWQKPEGLCDNAWKSMLEYVMTLANGGKDFYGGWINDPNVAIIACNDGLRPVIFKVEGI